MPIPDLPLFKHRDTVVTPADQNQFVTQFENTMDTMSNDVIPAINDAIVDINTKTVTATTARDEAVTAKNIAVAAKDEALTAVATLQEGAIDDTIIAPNKAFSNQYTNDNFVKLTGNQTIAGVKTFTSSPIVPTPTLGSHAVNKDYIDNLKTIAIGTATFTATTNNINLTGIGIGVEIGDVIQISGATDSKNNSEFTVEVITDNDNIIVNQAHANKGTSKNIANRASDTGVTVKLLAKWYNADDNLGRGWVDVSASRIFGVSYPNNTNRAFAISGWVVLDNNVYVVVNLTIGSIETQQVEIANSENIPFYSSVPKGENYSFSKSGSGNLRIIVKEYR